MAQVMKKKFEGELLHINPELLVSKNKEDKLENFFITLGLVFNDLKGLVLFSKLLEDHYEKPGVDEATIHAGNYNGTVVQINRLIASTIHEFFIFLDKNRAISDESEFKEILSKISKQDQDLWRGLFEASQGNLSSANNFLEAILKIRNNVGFHYYQAGKLLRDGYKSLFSRKERERNKVAYYSIGETIETTRFFFSDAAAEEASQIIAGKEVGGEPNESLDRHSRQLVETVNVLFPIIANIFKKYIKMKQNQPH